MKFVSSAITLIFSASIVSQVQAHMRMNEPPGLRSKEENVNPRGDDDHFPLKADGSDFPCQNSHRDPGHNPIRNYTVGTSVPVQIVPGALVPVGAPHGGGSCQFSLSYDNGVTFNVIHSIEGGCPLDAVMNKYTVPIPTTAPAAERALFAWTWFNRIGNREMYMNCAMVNIINPDTSVKSLDTPEIFKANIGAFGGFKTVETADVTLPDPGTSVDNTLGDRKLNQPILVNSVVQKPSPAPQVGVIMGSSGGGSGAGAGGSSAGVLVSPTVDGEKKTSTAVVTATGAAKTVTATAGQASATMDPECTDQEPAPAPATAGGGAGSALRSAFQSPTQVAAQPVATVANIGTSSGSSGATGGSCAEGSLVCSPDGTQFSMCVNGVAGPSQPVAPGTACRNGAIGYAKMIRRRRTWF